MDRVRRGNGPDLLAGLFLIAIGALAAWFVAPLRLGTPARMGPGFLPLAVSLIVAGLGLIVLARGFLWRHEPIERGSPLPLVAVSAAIAAFAALVNSAGLPLAVTASVIIASLAAPRAIDARTLAFAVALATFATLLFKTGLNVPFRTWPWS